MKDLDQNVLSLVASFRLEIPALIGSALFVFGAWSVAKTIISIGAV